MNTESNTKLEQLRKGEKVKCPRCENGFFSAVGDPKTTKVFRCDTCSTAMTLTIPFKTTQK